MSDLSNVNIRCCDDIHYETEPKEHLNFAWECWFDVDAVFGTNTKDDDGTWINFYTNWYPDGTVDAFYFVESDDKIDEFDYSLTEEETAALLDKMEKHCVRYTGGYTLSELFEACHKEEEQEKED